MHEDLPLLGRIAQTRGLDDRGAEPIVAVVDGFPVARAHAEADRALDGPSVLVDQLLHRDRALHGGHRAPEGDHHAVAERLHLLTRVLRDGAAEQREVHAAELVRRRSAERGGTLGRPGHVGEEDRDRLS